MQLLCDVAKNFKLSGLEPIMLPRGDIEILASVIQTTNKPCMIWVNFGANEWKRVPTVLSNDAPYVHSVTAIPPKDKLVHVTFGMWNGEKAVVIQDSWGLIQDTFSGKRIITESFYKARNLFAAYPTTFKFDAPATVAPHYDGSIVSLQDCLKYEGLFPSNQTSTGVYGNITRTAVIAFQKRYGISQTGNVGPITSAKLRELYK